MKFEAYKNLGCHASMSDAEIKEKYRDLCRDTHPDKGGDQDRFIIVAQSYALVRNEGARRKLKEYLELYGEVCLVCNGEGAYRRSKGFTGAVIRACEQCDGCGYLKRT